MRRTHKFQFLAVLASLLLSQMGCVALNIPSQRFHDPSDSGGIFGGWTNVGQRHPGHTEPVSQSLPVDPDGHLAGELCCDSEAGVGMESCDIFGGKPKPPKVPWPRFHPVPTRPVFGASPPESW